MQKEEKEKGNTNIVSSSCWKQGEDGRYYLEVNSISGKEFANDFAAYMKERSSNISRRYVYGYYDGYEDDEDYFDDWKDYWSGLGFDVCDEDYDNYMAAMSQYRMYEHGSEYDDYDAETV